MKQDVVHRLIGFILKYIWVLFCLLIALEVLSTLFIAQNLMKQTSVGVLQSVSGEISGRVDGVLRLLLGLSNDDIVADVELPLLDRAKLAQPYKDSYNLFMVALTDEDFNVASTNTQGGVPLSNLSHRDYLQRLYATGEYQITDAFPAGADGVTMNYTIAVPILKNDKVKGSVFGSIYFDDVQNVIVRSSTDTMRRFFLLGSDNFFMAGDNERYGKSLAEVLSEVRLIGYTPDEIELSFSSGEPVDHWQWGKDGLCYMTAVRVPLTDWTLVYQVRFVSVLLSLLPVLLAKAGFYLLLCVGISLFGRKYLRAQLDTISHLLSRVTSMQRELFETEHSDYDSTHTGYDAILEITQKGLTDELTGLFTRTMLLNRAPKFIGNDGSTGAVLFIDLDNLKQINDTFGHEAGDLALVHFAQVLKQYSQQHMGLASRYGGDEFVLLLSGVEESSVAKTAETLCTELRSTIELPDKHSTTIHASIGISLYPKHGDKLEALISKADVALYDAKRSGKDTWSCYSEHSTP